MIMFGPDDLQEAEADAVEIMQRAGTFPEEPIHVRSLCERVGVEVERSFGARLAHRREASIIRLGPRWVVHLLMRMTAEREAWVLGHELGHWLHRSTGRADRSEAYYDAVGACLVAPRPAFVEAARVLGHRVHELAAAFGTLQGLALLRLGEVVGRPVCLRRRGLLVARGEPFEWGSNPSLLPRDVAHPVRIDGSIGYMVDRGWREAA